MKWFAYALLLTMAALLVIGGLMGFSGAAPGAGAESFPETDWPRFRGPFDNGVTADIGISRAISGYSQETDYQWLARGVRNKCGL